MDRVGRTVRKVLQEQEVAARKQQKHKDEWVPWKKGTAKGPKRNRRRSQKKGGQGRLAPVWLKAPGWPKKKA